MKQIRITLRGDDESRVLVYTMIDGCASSKFLDVWKNITTQYNNQIVSFDFECPTPVSPEKQLQQNIFNICQNIVDTYPDLDIPDCWNNVPYNQLDLNILHDKFAENTQLQPTPGAARLLADLNFAIHELEAKWLNRGEEFDNLPPYVSSCSAYKIESQFTCPLTECDAESYDAGFKYQNCMIIGYNTLGKDLQALAFDNDIASMKGTDRYVPKTDIKSQFSIIIPGTVIDSDLIAHKRKSITTFVRWWAEENRSIDYGIDPDAYINRPGRMVIGHCDQNYYNWIMQQSSIHYEKVDFGFGGVKREGEKYRVYSLLSTVT